VTLSQKTILAFSSELDAATAAGKIWEIPGFEDVPLVVLEDGEQWWIECYDGGRLSGDEAARLLNSAGISPAWALAVDLPDVDWVAETQRLLPPVQAGPFIIRGSHDRHKIASHWAIEIDAGRAFGTAHHGTTKGCLLAIAAAASTRKITSALDLGTGSGVLAIAAAKALRHKVRICAADIDPIAIAVAGANSRKNGTADCIRFSVGNGTVPAAAYDGAPFELVIANILARPLLKLAPRLHRLTRLGGTLILSGLLNEQAREILGRYKAQGFALVRRFDLEGWSTLTMRRSC
jgi:ribosomal protein L11 methyltransferase